MGINYDAQQLKKLCEKNEIAYLALFGSYARGEATDKSDVGFAPYVTEMTPV
ncbi:MAG: hypothetical protein ACD_22C00238G0005 [uncultured bacterium]|nr:MAG: hypothetical protein ACD_22C00238G0005 [uncultured bacterium]